MDIVVKTEIMFGMKAWGEAGIDVFLAGATAGIEGGGSLSHEQRIKYETASRRAAESGYKTSINAYLMAYAQMHFLWWSWRKEHYIFNWDKSFYIGRPSLFNSPLRSSSTSLNLMSSAYRPASLGLRSASSLVRDVSIAAAPHYLFDGRSLAYSNIKTPTDNNDDRVQILTIGGSSADIAPAATTSPSFGFDVASMGGSKAVAAYEQASAPILESDLTASLDTATVIKRMASQVKVMGAVYTGSTWTADTLSKNAFANVSPRVALQSDGKASTVWSSGDLTTNDNAQQYVNGELLLSRYNGTSWSTPLSLLELDKNYILSDYTVSMAGDTTLIAASRYRTDENGEAATSEIVFISVDPTDNVEVFSGGYHGSNVHLKRIDGAYLLAFASETPDSARDVRLMTVDRYGRPNGAMDRFAGLGNHAIHNFKLAMREGGNTFDDLVLLWTEPEQVVTGQDGDGNDQYKIETSLYAAKPGKDDDYPIYTSWPAKMLTAPADHHIASYDAHVSPDGLTVKTAVTLANNSLGAEVVEETKTFGNQIAVTGTSYRVTDVRTDADLPIKFGLRNEGYQPLTSVDVTVNGNKTTTKLMLFPGEEASVEGILKSLSADFDGKFTYDIAAEFSPTDPTLRRAGLRASTPVSISGNGNVSTVDLGVSLFSNVSGDTNTTLLLKVVNNSALALQTGDKVKVGIYEDSQGEKLYGTSSEKEVSVGDLYDSANGNISKIVKFTVPNVAEMTTAYAIVTTANSANEIIDDNDETDNLIPVFLYPKAAAPQMLVILTDTLRDGRIGVAYKDTLKCDVYDPDKPVSWSVTGLPDGLTLETATGAISGTPTGNTGSFTLQVTATNADGSDAREVKLLLTAPAYNVSIATFEGGSVVADRESQAYDEGETVTLTVYPDEGYTLESISAAQTGDPDTPVGLNEDGDSYSFTMPAYGVTVTATFGELPNPDRDAVLAAKSLIESATFTVPQATANTQAAVGSWLVDIINNLIQDTGVSISASGLAVSDFTGATAGTAAVPEGVNGSFSLRVSLAKGDQSATAANSGTVTATPYTPPATYAISIGTTANGTVTADKSTAEAGETIVLTLVPADGYEPDEVTAFRTGAETTTVSVSGVDNTRSFVMPDYDVTVEATFRKTQTQLDQEAVETAKAAIEGGTFRMAQATGNDAESIRTWLVSTLSALFGQSHRINLRSGTSMNVDITVTAFTPAIAGTEAVPEGVNGSFAFTVVLTQGASSETAIVETGVIVATPYASTTVKRIELLLLSELTIRIINTGNVATGDLKLALSDASVFTLPTATVSSLPVGGEADISLTPRADLPAGTYTARLTVSGEGLTTVDIEISYAVETATDTESPSGIPPLTVWTHGARLHVSGLTAGKPWSVYGVSGALIYHSVAVGSEADIALPGRGMYIVISGGTAVKAVY
jgi:hypothetical protein